MLADGGALAPATPRTVKAKTMAREITDKYKKYRNQHQEAYEDAGARHPAQSPRTSEAIGIRQVNEAPFMDKTQAAVLNAQKAYRRAARRRARRARKRERKQEEAEEPKVEDSTNRHPAQSPRAGGSFWQEKAAVVESLPIFDDSEPDTPTPRSPTGQNRRSSQGGVSPHVLDSVLKQPVPNLDLGKARDTIRAHNQRMGTPSTPTSAQRKKMDALQEEARKHIRSFQPPKLNLGGQAGTAREGVRHTCQSPNAGGLTPRSAQVFKFKDSIKQKPALKQVAEGGIDLEKYHETDSDGFQEAGKRRRRRFNRRSDSSTSADLPAPPAARDGGTEGPLSPASEALSPAARRRRRKRAQEANLGLQERLGQEG